MPLAVPGEEPVGAHSITIEKNRQSAQGSFPNTGPGEPHFRPSPGVMRYLQWKSPTKHGRGPLPRERPPSTLTGSS